MDKNLMEIMDVNKSKGRYAQFRGQRVLSKMGFPLQGDIFYNDCILRFKDGFLDGGNEPAIEDEDGHIEYWTRGQPDRILAKPAIITDYGTWREYWRTGNFLKAVPMNVKA